MWWNDTNEIYNDEIYNDIDKVAPHPVTGQITSSRTLEQQLIFEEGQGMHTQRVLPHLKNSAPYKELRSIW